jgi:L-fuculose-phosphate aldolase
VPILPAVSNELASATSASLNIKDGQIKFDIVGQANHGACSVGKNPWDAFEHIERLEHICEIVLKSGVTP